MKIYTKVYRSNEEVKRDIVDGVLDLSEENVEFDFDDLFIGADIKARHIKAGNINAWDIKAGHINAWDIKAWDIDAGNIKAGDIDAGHINAWDIKAGDIDAGNINAGDIKAGDINAWDIDAGDINAGDIKAWNIDAGDINAEDIDYYAFCIAYFSLACTSIVGIRDNSLHKCLDQEIEFKEQPRKHKIRIDGKDIEISEESYKELKESLL